MSRLLRTLFVLSVCSAPVSAQPVTGLQPVTQKNWQTDPALAPVPTDSFLFLSIKFLSIKAGKLWDHPAAKPFRDWVQTQKAGPFDSMIGLSPAELDRVTLFLPTFPAREGEPLLLVTTRKPYNEAIVLKSLGVGQRDDRPFRGGGSRVVEIDGPFRWVSFLDDRTLLFLSDSFGERESAPFLLTRFLVRKADGPLATALAAAGEHDVALGLDITPFAWLVENDPERLGKDMAPFLVLLKAKSATFTADFDKTAKGTLTLSFPDATTAKRAAPVLEEGIRTLVEHLSGDGGKHLLTEPSTKLLADWAVSVLKSVKATAVGELVVATAEAPFGDALGKLVAGLPKTMVAARGNRKAMNNLKQLGIALYGFHDANGVFPGDTLGNFPKAPAWSWRVQILPYIEQDNIFRQLNLQLPWDDPANLKVLQAAEMPKVFELPGRPAPKGHTYFRILTRPTNAKGPDAPFFSEGSRIRIADITDGTSMTLMVVEAGEAVPWYKPDLFAYDSKLPLPQLGDKNSDLFLALFADGSVRALRPKKLGENTLRALITRAGGEVIDLPNR